MHEVPLPRRPRPVGGTANERLKARFGVYVGRSVTLAAAAHFALLAMASVEVPDFRIHYTPPLERIEIQRRVEIPPPPQPIARPAIPVLSTRIDISADITIGSSLIRDNPADRLPPPPTPSNVEISEQPRFTPYSVRPELRNPQEVQRALELAYPVTLKDAGIGGTTLLWVFIDTGGAVQNTRVVESSGYDDLDTAAQRVVRSTARFSPAYNRDQRVPVWIQLPITFRSLGE